MNIRQAITWIRGKMTEGYSHFAHHSPDALTSEEKLSNFTRADTGNCFANSLKYYRTGENDRHDKLINIYHISLDLSDIETSCQTTNAYTLFSIYNFHSKNDIIDLLDYNNGFDNGCDRLTTYKITSTDENQGIWFTKIANSSNSIIVYGDSNLQITDDHFIC